MQQIGPTSTEALSNTVMGLKRRITAFDKPSMKMGLIGTVSVVDMTHFYGRSVKRRYGTLKEDYGV